MGTAKLTPTTVSDSQHQPLWDDALERMIGRVRHTLDSSPDGFPHIGDPATGQWTTSPDGFWTGGFWVGMLWLAHRYTGDATYARAAEDWLRRLSSRVDSRTVFRGFLFYYGAVVGAELAGTDFARDIAVRAARSLRQAYAPAAGLIPLGREAEEAHTVGDDDANIDGLLASPLMLWAAKSESDADIRAKALSHAYKSAELFVQPDGSVIQSATFDPRTGAAVHRYTHKGITDDSIWTRAQAWAMLGYALSARIAPDEPRLSRLAEEVASWWLRSVPEDRVAYWDFSAPVTPETWRDTSGTAIAAAALMKVADFSDDASRYRSAAEETVRALVERHLTPVASSDHRPPGILADGCFDVRNKVALSNELIWGDYFLFESLGRLSGRLEGTSI
jgi:unsaturated chondroitin disaccharide hydrolase